MNYRHIYHAGNFADVVKHIVLIAILEQLKKKEKPFAILDAFAGVGIYNLASELALKTGENIDGVKKLHGVLLSDNIPELLRIFLNIVDMAGDDYYPGSPLITSHLLRSGDQLIASELHPEDYISLQKIFLNNALRPNIHIHNLDAYLAVKAFIPFKSNRGLVFLDPPFEAKDEFNKLLTALRMIRHRASTICTLIWYPIKDILEVENFYLHCKTIGFKEILVIEYELLNSLKNMNKCGLLVINPPNIAHNITYTMNYLTNHLTLKFNNSYL